MQVYSLLYQHALIRHAPGPCAKVSENERKVVKVGESQERGKLRANYAGKLRLESHMEDKRCIGDLFCTKAGLKH